ncbi:hypothetical protein AAFG07_33465 [Bradyrhizobium sp. B097]|uniref:hypothetical protein n=1 Tax=Bradyrhizobium sp. B097 TaxID=3140244 RepID=UPI0031840BCE
MFQEEEVGIWIKAADDEAQNLVPAVTVQGGRERGLILHKLMEEILTGEIDDAVPTLVARANELIGELGRSPVANPAEGLSPEELAGCVVRTLVLPEITALRPALVAEFPVYGAQGDNGEETVTAGIADALTFAADGRPAVVVDWKKRRES